MAKARTPCDWCKKRRVCEEVQVLMRGPRMRTLGKAAAWPLIFAREWKLCSRCRRCCKVRLDCAFDDVPE